MVTSFDSEYKLTKLIKQGKATMNGDFEPLASWIDKTYTVKTMNIIYDIIIPDNRPRLQIIFEFEKDEEKFYEKNKRNFNYDTKRQQAVANQFKKSLQDGEIIKQNGVINFSAKNKIKYKTDKILVVFSAFEPLAKEEANMAIPNEKIQELKKHIGNKDIWEIANSFSLTTFFFYTEKQVEENWGNGVKEKLTGMYFDLLKEYDEFNYLKKELYSISFDSKENFDSKYQSNWFYYFR